MTLYITDLLDNNELYEMIKEKRIFKQVHPDLPISIYNYTNRAQFINKWTEAERVCRGLIVEDATGRVIARGPEKFFNYGQTGAPEVNLDCYVRVSQKEDGSLGIGWKYEGHYGIATRGSFASQQAERATNKMMTIDHKAAIDYADDKGLTRLWEIVYPENRIVLDYKGRDELIPLGTVDNLTGMIDYRPRGGVVAECIHLKDALELAIAGDEEGFVLDIFGRRGTVIGHVKLKGEEYKILHGLLTNTNARRIWVQLAARDCHEAVARLAEKNEKPVEKVWATYVGSDPEDFKRVNIEKDIVETLLTNVPDEFYDWVTKKIDAINDTVSDYVIQSIMLAGQLALIDDKRTRHEMVKDHPLCKEILVYAEDRNLDRITLKAWKLAQPEGDDTPFKVDED